MTKLMLEAIEALRRLPEEQQDDIAGAVLRLARQDGPVYTLTADEQADLDESDAEVERGDFASDDDMKAIWAKHGL